MDQIYLIVFSCARLRQTCCISIYTGSGVWLTYANLKTIERLDMTTNVTQTIAKGITNAVDIDVHYEKGFVYWTDVQAHKILRLITFIKPSTIFLLFSL